MRQFSFPTGRPPLVDDFVETTLEDPPRTVINDSNGRWLATFTRGSRSVRVAGAERTFTEEISFTGVQDDFQRTRTDTWGNTVASGRWAKRTGDNEDFHVVPGWGQMRLDAVNASRRIAPSSYGYNYQFADVRVRVRSDKLTDGPRGTEQQTCIMLGYRKITDHYLATLAYDVKWVLFDDFSASETNGWGVEKSNELRTWINVGGPDSDYEVTGGKGVHKLTALNASRRSYVGLNHSDGEVYVEVTFPTEPSGGSLFASAILRYSDVSNHLLVQLRKTYASDPFDAELKLRSVVNGSITDIGLHTFDGQIAAGETWAIRARVEGDGVFGKAWKLGDVEPGAWQVSTGSAPLAVGTQFGVRSIASPSVTSGTHNIEYANFQCDDLIVGDRTRIKLQKRTGGSTSTLKTLDLPYSRSEGTEFWIRGRFGDDTTLKAKAWPVGVAEPDWQVETTDSDHSFGDVGLRSSLLTGYDLAQFGTVTHEYADYSVDARWTNPPKIVHSEWVYLLDAPYGGVITPVIRQWLLGKVDSGEQDILSFAMEYAPNAAAGFARFDRTLGERPAIPMVAGTQWTGDAAYGPRNDLGNRIEGGDFNDYIGVSINYEAVDNTSRVDVPEAPEFKSIDCSGLVRTVFGLRGGMDMQRYGVDWPDRLPRISFEIDTDGPGIVVFEDNVRPTQAQLDEMTIGDVVSFDAGVGVAIEEEGQIDHNGIFMGADVNGELRFISSRKTPNGPMFSDIGGDSVVSANRTNLYSRALRTVRRF